MAKKRQTFSSFEYELHGVCEMVRISASELHGVCEMVRISASVCVYVCVCCVRVLCAPCVRVLNSMCECDMHPI